MTQAEFLTWGAFYEMYPFDDYHRFHRPAAMVAQSMRGGEINGLLEWLAPKPVPDGYSQAELNSLKAFGFTPPSRRSSSQPDQ